MSWHYDNDPTYGGRRLYIEGLLPIDNKKEVEAVLECVRQGQYDAASVAMGISIARSILNDVDQSGESNNVSIGMIRLRHAGDVFAAAVHGKRYSSGAAQLSDNKTRAEWEAEGRPEDFAEDTDE